jgi:hypothetical protein
MTVHPDFISTVNWAPPTPSPGDTTVSPSVVTTTTGVPMTQLPTTPGLSDTATASVALGVGIFLLGAVVLAATHLRRRRSQMG